MKLLFSLLISLFILQATAQTDTGSHQKLLVISDFKAYQAIIKAKPNHKPVEVKKEVPAIVLDIRYATRNNFMHEVMYKQARAFARKPVVDQLKKIQSLLHPQGYGLKIFDAYRPYTITKAFYQKASDKNFVANPAKGSKHNRGCAVDLTIIDLKTGKDVPMPTPYDSFSPAASPGYTQLPTQVIKNRDFLISVMEANGFKVIHNEWWHFDFIGWGEYELMDIPFEKL